MTVRGLSAPAAIFCPKDKRSIKELDFLQFSLSYNPNEED